MQLFNRKNQLERFLENVADTLDVSGDVKGLRSMGSGKARKTALIAAGGLAGLTAGSAGISSIRRHREEARDDS